MKHLLLGALAATALATSPALAQTAQTGVVTINGSVDQKCTVTSAGTPAQGDSFGGTVDLGKIDNADGTLLSNAALVALFNAAGTANLNYRIVCTSPGTSVNIDADPIANNAATPGTGYANTVNYTATVVMTLTDGAQSVSNNTETQPGGTNQTFDKPMATGASNVGIVANNFHAPNATDVMMAGTYTGKITITITPEN